MPEYLTTDELKLLQEDNPSYYTPDELKAERLTPEILGNLGDRRAVLGLWRSATPAQQQQILQRAPAIAEGMRSERGGALSRTASALGRGVSAVAQPIMELTGFGGTEDEIRAIHQLEGVAAETIAPATSRDPWYQAGPLQALEMVPWMATVVGGGAAGAGLSKATGLAPAMAKLAGMGRTTMRAAEVAGITAAGFPGQYSQELESWKNAGIDINDWRAKAGAMLTAAGTASIEAIVPNPFKVGKVPLDKGALAAGRAYLWNAMKKLPVEGFGEEALQGLSSGFARAVATHLDENAPDQNLGTAFEEAWDQGTQAIVPMAFMMGVPAVAGAATSAARASQYQQRLADLKAIRAKGPISRKAARDLGIEGTKQEERTRNADIEIQQLEQEIQDAIQEPEAEAIPPLETPPPGGQVGTEVRRDDIEAEAGAEARDTEVPLEPTSSTVEETRERVKAKKRRLLGELLEADETTEGVDGAFERSGWQRHYSGMWVDPEVDPEWVDQLAPETFDLMKSHGLTFIQYMPREHAAGQKGHIQHGDMAIRGVNVATERGMSDLFTTKDHIVRHEIGHHAWEALTDEQRQEWSDGPRVTQHGKDIERQSGYRAQTYQQSEAAEEDFAEAFSEANGDVDSVLRRKSVSPADNVAPSEVAAAPEVQVEPEVRPSDFMGVPIVFDQSGQYTASYSPSENVIHANPEWYNKTDSQKVEQVLRHEVAHDEWTRLSDEQQKEWHDVAATQEVQDFMFESYGYKGGKLFGEEVRAHALYPSLEVDPDSVPDAIAVLAAKQQSEGEVAAAPEVQVEEPPVPEGRVRFYHAGQLKAGEPRWLSQDRKWAENFRPGAPVSYVDLPADSPLLTKAFDDEGTDQTAPYNNFEAPPEIAEQLQPLTAPVPEAAVPVEPPAVTDEEVTPPPVKPARTAPAPSEQTQKPSRGELEEDANEFIAALFSGKVRAKDADEAWQMYRRNVGADTRGTPVIDEASFKSNYGTFAAAHEEKPSTPPPVEPARTAPAPFSEEKPSEERPAEQAEMDAAALAALDKIMGKAPAEKKVGRKRPVKTKGGQFVLPGMPGMAKEIDRQDFVRRHRDSFLESVRDQLDSQKAIDQLEPAVSKLMNTIHSGAYKSSDELLESSDAWNEAYKALEGVIDEHTDTFAAYKVAQGNLEQSLAETAKQAFADRPKSGRKPPKRRSQKTLESAAEDLQAAHDAAKALMAKINSKLTSGVDPAMMAETVEVAYLYAKAGVNTFKGYVEAVVENFSDEFARNFAPYMESGWRALHTRGVVDDPAGKVEDFLEVPDGDVDEAAGPTDQAAGPGDRGDRSERPGTAGDQVLEGVPSEDDQGAEQVEGTEAVRDRPAGEEGSGTEAADSERGDERGGRGADSGRAPSDDTGRGRDRAPRATRPNYHLTNTDAIIGGGPKAKFERNRRAIEIVRDLEESVRPPTAEELDILAGYTGWGAFGQELFKGTWDRPRPKEGWEDADEWLRIYLGEEDWKSAQQSIVNAHFTDPQTVTAIWDGLRRMGFEGGRVLEPSMGIGNFFALMPRDLMGNSRLTGIELDNITANIARSLHPDANIQQMGYQESQTPDNFYDVIVSNVPFGNYKIPDRRYKQDFSIHNYFFKKAFDQLKPGGVLAFITSNSTMDGKVQAKLMRAQIANDGDLVAAIRLPTGAFQAYAGTKVVADLVVIRKRKPGEEPTGEKWTSIVDYETPAGETIAVNEYWLNHPENILGTMTHGHGTTSGRPGMIVDPPADLQAALDEAMARLPEGTIDTERAPSEGRERANLTQMRQNSVISQDDDLWIVKGEQLLPLIDFVPWRRKKGTKAATIIANRKQIESALDVREAMREVLGKQAVSEDATKSRAELNRVYDAFVAKYGPLGKSAAVRHLVRAGDPMAATMLSLEAEQEDGTFTKRPIFERSTVRQRKVVEKPTVDDAFAMERNRSLDLDMERIAAAAKVPVDQVISELESGGKIYKTGTGTYDAADVFLRGNMARKLRQLQAAQAEGMDGLERSIEAVQERLPEPIPYSQIEAKLGATWVEAGDYADFLGFLLNEPASSFDVEMRVNGWRTNIPPEINAKTEAQHTHGHRGISFNKLMNAAMNNATVKLTMEDPENPGSRIADPVSTAEANTKISELREKFTNWIWTSPDRITRLSGVYNEEFNSTVTPDFSDVPLDFEGLTLERGDQPFNLRQHQESAVWRGIVSGRGIYGHQVGTGKTLTMGALAMESRRLGLASKPLLLAHNANSQAVRNEIQEAYPNANILYVDNLDAQRKEATLQAIATEDWDLIIVPHSMADRFQMRPETVERLLQPEMDALEAAALEAYEESEAADFSKGSMPANLDDVSSEELRRLREPTAKELVKERLKLRAMITKAAQAMQRGTGITFEDMGVDMVMVDEAHIFKKLPITTKQNIKGLNKTASKRGTMMLMLADYIRGNNNGRGAYMFTGTPITNTINEIYNMMRFVMAEDMEAAGVRHWDGWFNTFATQETLTELSSGGTWENFDRLSSFVNLPELRQMVGQYMDIVFAEDMPEFSPRDRREGRTENPVGIPFKQIHNTTLEMIPHQQAHSEELKERYTTFKNAQGRDKVRMMREPGGRYNPLVIEGEGVKLAMDPRLTGFGTRVNDEGAIVTDWGPETSNTLDPKDPALKINRMLQNAMAHYHEHPKATQMIFMQVGHNDWTTRTLGRTHDGEPITERVRVFNLAKEVKRRLIEEGVAENEIAIFSTMSKSRRTQAAQDMRDGKIRFAIGSTETMGTGVNAQDEMAAMHHLDAPWMPGDLEQRNGRGHRQGNKWNTVHEYRYLTEGPQDGRRWQVLLTKSRFIDRFMRADGTERTIEMDDIDLSDDGSGTDMEQSFAAAAGDPRVQMRIRLEGQVQKLERARDSHARTITETVSRANQKLGFIETTQKRIDLLQQEHDTWRENKPDKPTITIRDQVITGKDKIRDELKALEERYQNTIGAKVQIGEYRGLPLFNNNGILYVGESNLNVRWSEESLQGVLSNIPARIDKLRMSVEKDQRFIDMAHGAVGQPFPKQLQLDSKRAKLQALQDEMEANPGASPAWLRAGAPVGTTVFHKGNEYEVAGHRGDEQILYAVGDNFAPLPAKEVTDKDGTPLFPELQDRREWTAEEIQDRLHVDYELVAPGETPKILEGLPVKPIDRWQIVSPGGFAVGQGDSPRAAYESARTNPEKLIRLQPLPEEEEPAKATEDKPKETELAGAPGDVGAILTPAEYVSQAPETSRGKRTVNRLKNDREGTTVGFRQIVKDFTDALQAEMRIGSEQLRTPGQYQRTPHLIRSMSDVGPWNFHEQGHALAEVLSQNERFSEWMVEQAGELIALTQRDGTAASAETEWEGFAELVRLSVTAPSSVPAPLQQSMFEMLNVEHPDVAAALRDAHRGLVAHMQRPVMARQRSHAVGPKRGAKNAVTELVHRSMYNLMSAEAAVSYRLESPIVNAALTAGKEIGKKVDERVQSVRDWSHYLWHIGGDASGAIFGRQKQRGATVMAPRQWFSDTQIEQLEAAGAVIPESQEEGNRIQLTDYTINDIAVAVGRQKWPEFLQYAQSKSALERWEKHGHEYPGRSAGERPEQLRRALQETESNNPEFEEQQSRLTSFLRQIMLLNVLSGEVTTDQYQTMVEAHEFYVPLPRQVERGESRLGSSAGQLRSQLRRAHGSVLPFQDLKNAISSHVHAAYRAYYHNAVRNAVKDMQADIQAMEDVPAEAKWAAQRVMVPLRLDSARVATLNRSEMQEVIAEYLNETEEYKDNPIDPKDIDVNFPGKPIIRSKSPRAVNVLTRFEGGKVKFEQVKDELLYDFFTRVESPSKVVQWLSNFFGGPGQAIKDSITNSVSFVPRAMFRDLFGNVVLGRGMERYIPGVYWAAGSANQVANLFDAGDKSVKVDTELLSNSFKHTHSDQHILGVNRFVDFMSQGILVDGWKHMNWLDRLQYAPGQAAWAAYKPFQALNFPIRYASQWAESTPREGAAVVAKRKGATDIRSTRVYDEISGNFISRPGSNVIASIYRFAMFLNPGMQVVYQVAERATQKRSRGDQAVAMAYLGAMSALAATVTWALMDDEEREQYVEQPEDSKLRDLPVKVPGLPMLRMPIPYGPEGAVVGYTFNKTMEQMSGVNIDDKKLLAQAARRTADMPVLSSLATPIGLTTIEAKANYSFWLQRAIVPESLKTFYRDDPASQAYESTPEFYKRLGEKLEVSPIMAEYVVGNLVGTQVEETVRTLSVLNEGKLPKDLSEYPQIGRLFWRPSIGYLAASVKYINEQSDAFDKARRELRKKAGRKGYDRVRKEFQATMKYKAAAKHLREMGTKARNLYKDGKKDEARQIREGMRDEAQRLLKDAQAIDQLRQDWLQDIVFNAVKEPESEKGKEDLAKSVRELKATGLSNVEAQQHLWNHYSGAPDMNWDKFKALAELYGLDKDAARLEIQGPIVKDPKTGKLKRSYNTEFGRWKVEQEDRWRDERKKKDDERKKK